MNWNKKSRRNARNFRGEASHERSLLFKTSVPVPGFLLRCERLCGFGCARRGHLPDTNLVSGIFPRVVAQRDGIGRSQYLLQVDIAGRQAAVMAGQAVFLDEWAYGPPKSDTAVGTCFRRSLGNRLKACRARRGQKDDPDRYGIPDVRVALRWHVVYVTRS